jgi:hypothetical protein
MTDAHHPDTPRNRGDSDAPHMSPVTPSEDARRSCNPPSLSSSMS